MSWDAWAYGARDVEPGSDAAKMAALEAQVALLRTRRGALQNRAQTPELQKRFAALGAELKAANVALAAIRTDRYKTLFKEVAKEMLPAETYEAIYRETNRREIELERGRRERLVGQAVDVRGSASGPKERDDASQ